MTTRRIANGWFKVLLRGTAIIVSLIIFCVAAVSVGWADDAGLPSNASFPLLYVCNHESRNISVIDTGTNEVIRTINGPSSPYGVAVSPDGSRLYVSSQSGAITVIDRATGCPTGNLEIGPGAGRCIISPDGSRLYIVCGADIIAVDTARLRIAARIPSEGKALTGMAISPDGSRLYVADRDGRAIIMIDTCNASVAGNTKLDTMPLRLVISPDGSRIYAACVNNAAMDEFGTTVWSWLSPAKLIQAIIDLVTGGGHRDINAIYEIDAASCSVTRTVDTGGIPFGIALSPNGSCIYATCGEYDRSYVEIIDTSTGRIADRINAQIGLWTTMSLNGLDTWTDGEYLYVINGGRAVIRTELRSNARSDHIMVGDEPSSMAESTDGQSIYIACRRGNGVAVIDTGNGTLKDTLRLWWDPQYIALSPDGSRAYVTSENAGTVSIVNTSDYTISGVIEVPDSPRHVTVSPDGSRVFVAHYGENYTEDGIVSVIDALNNTVARQLKVGFNPRGFAFSSDGNSLYIVCENPVLIMLTPWNPAVKEIGKKRNDSLYVIDVHTGDVRRTGDIMYMPSDIAVSPDGSRLYVTCTNGTVADKGDVRVIDADSLTQLAALYTGDEPKGIALSPDGKTLYLIHRRTSKVSVINATDGMVIASIPGHYEPGGVVVSPDGSRVYVTCDNWPVGHVSVIDAGSNKVIKTIDVGTWPTGVAFSPMRDSGG